MKSVNDESGNTFINGFLYNTIDVYSKFTECKNARENHIEYMIIFSNTADR